MTFDKPIIIQKIDDVTEQWSNLWSLHARVNKTTGSEFVEEGRSSLRRQKRLRFGIFKISRTLITIAGYIGLSIGIILLILSTMTTIWSLTRLSS